MGFHNRYSLWLGAGMFALVGGVIAVAWRPVVGALVAASGLLASLLYWRTFRTGSSTLESAASLDAVSGHGEPVLVFLFSDT